MVPENYPRRHVCFGGGWLGAHLAHFVLDLHLLLALIKLRAIRHLPNVPMLPMNGEVSVDHAGRQLAKTYGCLIGTVVAGERVVNVAATNIQRESRGGIWSNLVVLAG